MLKKGLYGAIGVMLSVLFLFNMATGMGKIPIVKTEREAFAENDFDIPFYNSNEYLVEVFDNNTYVIPQEELAVRSLENRYTHGRLNPMRHWTKEDEVLPETKEEKEDTVVDTSTTVIIPNNKQEDVTVDVESDVKTDGIPSYEDSIIELGGNPTKLDPKNVQVFNTYTKQLEMVDASELYDDFKTAQFPVSKVGFRATSRFGKRDDPVKALQGIKITGVHTGYDFVNTDISNIKGKSTVPTKAVLGGKVITKTPNDKGYGNYVEISHGNYSTLYAHFDTFNDTLNVGDTVTKGDVLGYVGSTGNSTGNHVHFEVIQGDIKIDPEVFILRMLGN